MKYEEIYNALIDICKKQKNSKGVIIGVTADEIAKKLKMQRTNVVREFSKLIELGKIEKKNGRPVRYLISEKYVFEQYERSSVFDNFVGGSTSLKNQIALAKAAIVYPPNGLHTLIVGETGVGKSYFAKAMFKYAVETNMIKNCENFAVFNCADYANNPQLLISHLFGVKKGAYTGSTEDKEGIIEKARDGILFLDEVHRLPPEGQEMLFTLIDEGKYVKLGSITEIRINVMIIAATTENIESSLLKTFTRRIPVVITLPPLRDRTMDERLQLIKNFFEEESKRINKKIEVDEDVLTSLLSYDCTNNIGELKSDIQIACAKAFLRSMFETNKLKVKLDDFNEKVRAGILKANKITSNKINLKFSEIGGDISEEDKYTLSKNIYEFVEKRTLALKEKGLEIEEIKNKVSIDVEKFINNYLSNINTSNVDDEMQRLVNSELYDYLKSFMPLAEYRLRRKISKNTFIGLLIHLDTFIGRARLNKIIENPKLEEIRQKYSQEFKVAMLLAEKIETKFMVRVPLDEIGFIAMFFAADIEESSSKVIVLVAMHGKSTATSMVEVVNHLLNTDHAIGFDMPLTMKPEEALKKLEKIIQEKHEGKGVLLLVDMGSLRFFDKMISNLTGINVKVVDEVTTVMAIKATRMAIMNSSLEEIIDSLNAETRVVNEVNDLKNKSIIITACTTGEGTAQKLKEMLYKKYDKDKYEIINLSIKEKDKFLNAVESIREKSNVLAIVSPFPVKIDGIEYISLENIFEDSVYKNINGETDSYNIKKSMKKIYTVYLELQNSDYLVDYILQFIQNVVKTYKIHIDNEKINGIMMHFGCLIEKLISREDTVQCKNTVIIKNKYLEIYKYFKSELSYIETLMNIRFSDDDICNLIEMIVNL